MGTKKYRVHEWFMEELQEQDDFYDLESLSDLVDNDMIAEGGFMSGYLGADEQTT